MKKMILAALIGATTLTPALAMAQDRGQRQGRGDSVRESGGWQRGGDRQQGGGQQGGWQRGGDRQQGDGQRGGDRPQQAQTPPPAQQPQYRPQPQQPQQQAPQQQAQQPRGGWGQDGRGQAQQPRGGWGQDGRGQAQQPRGGWGQDGRGQAQQPQYRPGQRDGRPGGWDQGRRDDRSGYRQDQRRYGDWRDQPQYRRGWDDNRNWNRGWRGDNRYDWNRYRTQNRHVYRLPRYYAPAGWGYGYRRFSIGLTIGSMLFAPSYWINDPFYYRLPPAYGSYRWVRYYNDALLVDIRTGYVVDVIYDIFW